MQSPSGGPAGLIPCASHPPGALPGALLGAIHQSPSGGPAGHNLSRRGNLPPGPFGGPGGKGGVQAQRASALWAGRYACPEGRHVTRRVSG